MFSAVAWPETFLLTKLRDAMIPLLHGWQRSAFLSRLPDLRVNDLDLESVFSSSIEVERHPVIQSPANLLPAIQSFAVYASHPVLTQRAFDVLSGLIVISKDQDLDLRVEIVSSISRVRPGDGIDVMKHALLDDVFRNACVTFAPTLQNVSSFLLMAAHSTPSFFRPDLLDWMELFVTVLENGLDEEAGLAIVNDQPMKPGKPSLCTRRDDFSLRLSLFTLVTMMDMLPWYREDDTCMKLLERARDMCTKIRDKTCLLGIQTEITVASIYFAELGRRRKRDNATDKEKVSDQWRSFYSTVLEQATPVVESPVFDVERVWLLTTTLTETLPRAVLFGRGHTSEYFGAFMMQAWNCHGCWPLPRPQCPSAALVWSHPELEYR